MRNIIHDWHDAEAIKIFLGVRKAMGPKSRVLIRESIVVVRGAAP
jgi:hypothetical protein